MGWKTLVFIVQVVLIRKLKNFSTIRDTDSVVNKWASGISNSFFFFPSLNRSILICLVSFIFDIKISRFSLTFCSLGYWTNHFSVLPICNLFLYSKCTFTLFNSNLFDARFHLQPSAVCALRYQMKREHKTECFAPFWIEAFEFI